MPLSAISLAFLEDMGYGINYSNNNQSYFLGSNSNNEKIDFSTFVPSEWYISQIIKYNDEVIFYENEYNTPFDPYPFMNNFGYMLSINYDGTKIAIASEKNVVVYHLNGSTWSENKCIDISQNDELYNDHGTFKFLEPWSYVEHPFLTPTIIDLEADYVRTSLAFDRDGTRFVCGSTSLIQTYNYDNNTWQRVNTADIRSLPNVSPTATVTNSYSQYEHSQTNKLDISHDGNTLVTGDTNFDTIDYPDSDSKVRGSLFVYDYNDSSNKWDLNTLLFDDITNEIPNDSVNSYIFPCSLAISGDGNTIAASKVHEKRLDMFDTVTGKSSGMIIIFKRENNE